MSAPLPLNYSTQPASFDGLLNDLLQQQQTRFSAVELFANWHDEQAHTHELAPHYSVLMPASPLKAGEQYAFEVDLDACSGCKACVVACHNLNNLEPNETWRKVGYLTSKESEIKAILPVSMPVVQHVTTACHHCVDPGCLSGCPVKAYEKDPLTGIVKHLDDQCFGCKYCTMMCPYEVPQYSATLGIVRKCDMCHQRLANHEAPACVQACPNKAIRIQSVETAVVRQRGALTEAALLPTAPPNSITLPTTQFVSKRTIPANVLSAEVVSDEPHEGHWPLVGMLVLTQASVGLWLMIALSLAIKVASTIELKLASIIATSLGVVGVHLALLHLGRPQLAYRAFLGWRTSWLSREAIAFGVYMAAASVATIAILFADVTSDWLGATAIILLTMTVALIGIAGVFCSAMIYVATQRELWNKRRTLSGFLGTLVALGLSLALLTTNSDIWGTFALLTCIVTAATFAPQVIDVARSSSSSSPSPRFGERGPGGEGLSLASPQFPHPSPLLRKARGEGANEVQPTDFSSRSGKLITKHLARPWYLMWFCFLGAVICSGLVYVTTGNTTLFGVLSVVLFFASHLIHRWIYFSAIVTYRMPGAST